MFSMLKSKTEAISANAEFEQLMRGAYRQAHSVAYRLTGNQVDAEDLLQESFVRAFRFFHRYDRSLPFLSWMYRIISNAHIDMVRRRNKLKPSSLDHGGKDGDQALEIADLSFCPGVELIRSSYSDCVQKALNAMNPEFRMAVVLSDVEGMSYEEIAAIMETSIGTVRSRIHRGRTQLRGFLLKLQPETYGRMI
jgi:RNA polymerase sigma-70 factor (ECF subfamily)